MVAAVGVGWLVTVGPENTPQATLLPVIWKDDTLVTHMAKANGHWRQITPDAPALVIVTGPDAYITPSWYATKAEHGRVVPTWNYSAVHLTGTVTVHTDPAWLHNLVSELTDHHEQPRAGPWEVADAPDDYVQGLLKAIVGVEMKVEKVEGKAKLSQNRSEADRDGVIEGLREEAGSTAEAVAAAMEDLSNS